MSKVINTSIVVGITLVASFVLFMLIPWLFGYHLSYNIVIEKNYAAISAVGQWVSAIGPFLLVPISAFISYRISKVSTNIKDSNIATTEYVEKIVKDMMVKQGTINAVNTEESNRDELKEKAVKYISIQGFSKTNKVAEYLGIENEKAFELLEELLKYDKRISAGGYVHISNINTVLWLKK